MHNTALVFRLALADLWYDRKVSFCIIAAIISVITPLLLLFSLKYGVVSQLRHQLLNDPQNLEIRIVGNLQFDTAMFVWLKAQPETAFAIPLTRSLNTQADLTRSPTQFVNNVEIIPTDLGDPITDGIPPFKSGDDVILSALAAEKLGAAVGDIIKLVVTRKLNGRIEKGISSLTVSGILPETRYSRAAVFTSIQRLIEIEDFYDGFNTSLFISDKSKGAAPEHDTFARARLYAKSLESVAPLALKLRELNIETRTQAKAIENMQAIDNVLGFIFTVIALTSILGCVLSFAGSFLSNIERKRKDIAFMRLLGFKSFAIMKYLVMQATLLSCAAFAASTLLFVMGNLVVNSVLGANLTSQPLVSQLQFGHLVVAFCLTLVVAIIVVAIGGGRAIKIQPAESLRDI